MKKSVVLLLTSVFVVALTLEGCTTVRKGAGKVGQGVGSVAKGAGNVVKGTGNAVKGVGKGVGNTVGAIIPGNKRIELEPGEETDRRVRQVVVDGEVKRYIYVRREIYPFKRREKLEGDAITNQVLREKAWAKVVNSTEMRLVGDNRVRIDVKGPLVIDIEEMEYLLLGRAAGEAARSGYDRFAIVYINYSGGGGLTSILLPDVSATSGSSWIGAYEDLVAERESQRLVGGYNKFSAKDIEAVVLFLPSEDRRRRDTFPATEVYLNMLNEGLYDGKYPYKN